MLTSGDRPWHYRYRSWGHENSRGRLWGSSSTGGWTRGGRPQVTGRQAILGSTPGVEQPHRRLLNCLHDATWSRRSTSLLVVLLGFVLRRWKISERKRRGSRNRFTEGYTLPLRGASRRACGSSSTSPHCARFCWSVPRRWRSTIDGHETQDDRGAVYRATLTGSSGPVGLIHGLSCLISIN